MSEQNSPAEAPQPQQSMGTAPSGQETMGQETMGQAPPPAQATEDAATPATTEAPKKKGGGVARFLIAILIVIVAGGVYWFFSSRDDIAKAKVGDCLAGSTLDQNLVPQDLKITECGQPDAVAKVVERIENKTQIAFGINPGCTHPDTAEAIWMGKEGEPGAVLCLAKAS